MKRIIAAAAAAAMLISLVGCQKQNDTDTEVSSVAASAAESSAVSSHEIDHQALLEKIVRQFQFEGVVYVTKNGEVLCTSATSGNSGEDSTQSDTITLDSQFYIGSVSKQFTAAAVMLLKEQGKLTVDDTLDMYFPEYIIGKDITIKNLLTMRSGITDYYTRENDDGTRSPIPEDEIEFEIYNEADAYHNKHEILNWLFNQPLNFDTDTQYEYSNSNYIILSEIVEIVSGVEYNKFVKENIFDPLEMNDTGFIDELKTSPKLAENKKEFDVSEYPGVTTGAGDIISTAADMDKWLAAFRECTLLSESSYKEMTTNYSDDQGVGYGYGLMLDNNGGVMHAGEINSYLCVAYINQKYGYDLFAATNNDEALLGDISEFTTKIIDKTMRN